MLSRIPTTRSRVGARTLNGDIKKKMKILALIVFLAFVILVLYNIGKDRE
jgi:hypothetical protein